ncbi:major facilitator superfamily domain-containing protein [Aspergillus bertholletiae]|uniref:Major facilitator superfamily domain-containing protein n=1 Tax=Aspergillus bertholletiae TaxID=1226010 RepID=A0A5N7APZ2_9EURO|nr:major facilitator superfamily domain-containing protein [Aspergillus bertholletiae]
MEARRPEVLAVSIVFFVIASVFVILRFVSRVFIVKKVALHDYLMLLAWVIDFGFSFTLFYATSKGLGLHDDDIALSDRYSLNRANYAFTVLYNPALMAVKSSILVFYLTLTQGERVFRCANYVTLFVVNAAGLALTLVNVFQCRPVGAAFSYPLSPDARCTDILTLYLSSSPVNIITDLAILFLPNPILTRMRLPRKQKIILVITFSFGFFVAVVDVIRIAYLQSAATSRQILLNEIHLQDASGDDLNWYASLSFMWSVVEVNVSVMCACVPSLKPLVARIIPKMIRDTDDSMTVPDAPTIGPQDIPDIPDVAEPAPLPTFPGSNLRRRSPSVNHSKPSPSGSGSSTSQRDMDGPIDMREFLMVGDPPPPDAEANTTITTTSYLPSITFFDFVNMKKPANMLKLSNKESIAPISLTTILFFLWGFAYGLLDILNTQFQDIVRLDAWRSLGLNAVYFGGYFIGPPLVGRTVLKHWGFKSTFITGLCIYACGTLIFWPSAVLTSYSAFIISNFIVGFGLAVLETAANPFIALCGPLENSEIRLNISQGVQAVGSVVSPLLAKKVLFKSVTDVSSLVDVQWTYLGIALFDVLLAVAFYYLPIPEASDEDLQELANRRRSDNMTLVAGIPVVWLTLGLGVYSQFFYVAGQEILSQSFVAFVEDAYPSLNSFDYLTIGHSVFAVGRFLAAFLQWFLKPRWILLLSYIGMIVFSILCTKTTGVAAVAMALMVYLFESGVFSIIFATSLRGTGQHTKTAATLLTMAVSGGACFPFAQYAASLAGGVPFSYSVLVAVFCAGAIFPIYLNLVPAAKKQVDPVPNEHLRRPRRHRPKPNIVQREKDNPSEGGVYSRRRSVLSDLLPAVNLSDQSPSQSQPDLANNEHPRSAAHGGLQHDLAPWPES